MSYAIVKVKIDSFIMFLILKTFTRIKLRGYLAIFNKFRSVIGFVDLPSANI